MNCLNFISSKAKDCVTDRQNKTVQQFIKVKVVPGLTPSQSRVPLDKVLPELTTADMEQRRDYIHYVMKQRLEKTSRNHHQNVERLVLPYVTSS